MARMTLKPKIEINRLPMDVIEKEIKYVWKEFGNVWGYGISKKTRNLIGKPVVAGQVRYRKSKKHGGAEMYTRKFRKTRAQGKPPTSRVPDSDFGLRFNTQPHWHKADDYVMRAGFQTKGSVSSGVTELLEFGGMTTSYWIWENLTDERMRVGRSTRYIKHRGVIKRTKPDRVIFDAMTANNLQRKHPEWTVKVRKQKTYNPSLQPAADYYNPRAAKEFSQIMAKRLSPGGMTKKVQGIRKRKGMG